MPVEGVGKVDRYHGRLALGFEFEIIVSTSNKETRKHLMGTKEDRTNLR